MYESPTTAGAEELLRRYAVRYVVVGPLELTEYGDGGVAKWDRLGERVYDAAGRVAVRGYAVVGGTSSGAMAA